jgi:hypothetical protein
MSLEMAHKVIVPQKKIMSRSFLNSGTLIVIENGTGILNIFVRSFITTCDSQWAGLGTVIADFLLKLLWLLVT